MTGPISGVKILGFTHFAQGPFALQILADYGAEVINIEKPGSGEFERDNMVDEKINGESAYFLAMNRNKRSLSLNLKTEIGKEIVYKLIQGSNVLVSNFRPGVLEKLGFGFDKAKEINNQIIYCEAFGYGSSGPYKDLPGQDMLAQCISGYTTIVGTEGKPSLGGTFLVDMYSASLLAGAICAALYNQKSGGAAQKIEVNLLDAALHIQSQEISYYLNTGNLPKKPTYPGHVHMEAPYGLYETKDGYIAISTVAPERAKKLGEVLDIYNLSELMPNKSIMFRDREKIYSIIQDKLRKHPSDYWIEKLQAEGFWSAKVKDYSEMEKDPQILHNQIIQIIDHPRAGKIRVVGPAVSFSQTPVTIRRPPPLLGEQNYEILLELGYSEDEIRSFEKMGIF